MIEGLQGTGKTKDATIGTTALRIGPPGTGMADGPVEVENLGCGKKSGAPRTGVLPLVVDI
jgi:hypothetical protein